MNVFRSSVLALTFGAILGTGPALAIDADIETRQSLMRSVKAAMKVSAAMAKGEMEYDPVKATLAMNTFYAAAVGFPQFFSKDNSADLDTEAGAKIWSDANGFAEKAAAFRSDAAAAIKTAGDGFDAYRGAFGGVARNCKGCHEAYRVKKQ